MINKVLLSALVLASSVSYGAFAEQSTTINTLDANKVTAKGKPVVLLGNGVAVGQKAPDFRVVDDTFQAKGLGDYQQQAVLLSVVPSLDTGVCSIQTKHFNEQVAANYPQVAMLTISTDLPFAQKRYCAAEGIDKLETLSDAVWRDFAENYGLLIKDMGILSRAVFVLDKEHKVVYKELVSELSKEPDYKKAIAALDSL